MAAGVGWGVIRFKKLEQSKAHAMPPMKQTTRHSH
jgi:hypothetical protein